MFPFLENAIFKFKSNFGEKSDDEITFNQRVARQPRGHFLLIFFQNLFRRPAKKVALF